MKKQILSLIALGIVSSIPAYAQLASTPLEPGLLDYMKRENAAAVTLVGAKRMMVGPIMVEWVSPRQITLVGEVADIAPMSQESLKRLDEQIRDFNDGSAVGTVSIIDGRTLRLEHHLNPENVALPRMAGVITRSATAVEELRRMVQASMASHEGANRPAPQAKLGQMR